jgi:hypothetical protein
MRRRLTAPALLAIAIAVGLVHAKPSDPLIYTIRFPDPASKIFTVGVAVPTDGAASVDLMMPCGPTPGLEQKAHLAALLAHSRR